MGVKPRGHGDKGQRDRSQKYRVHGNEVKLAGKGRGGQEGARDYKPVGGGEVKPGGHGGDGQGRQGTSGQKSQSRRLWGEGWGGKGGLSFAIMKIGPGMH